MKDAKSNFTFAWFVILSFLFFSIDIVNLYIKQVQIQTNNNKVYAHFIEILQKLGENKLFSSPLKVKLLVIIFIIIAIILGTDNKKFQKNNKDRNFSTYFIVLISLGLYLTSHLFLSEYIFYSIFSIVFFLTFVISLFKIVKYIRSKLGDDRFSEKGREFEQTKELIVNDDSVNIKSEDGWVNIINPFRASAVIGTPGSGKTFVFLLEAIIQSLNKNYVLFVYDYKFSELTTFTYNVYKSVYNNKKIQLTTFCKFKKFLNIPCKNTIPVTPKFNIINFDDIEYTNRSNPLQPELLVDTMDAVESAKTILTGLNKTWLKKEGDFFVESAINFFAIIIWSLKLYKGGKYCTLPHAIQLISKDYKSLFSFLGQFDDKFIYNVLEPFKSALENETFDQLDGQVASARLSLAKLTSKTIYYVMTTGNSPGANVSLDINNPENPRILCIGNNPERQEIYGACISLYTTRLLKLINKKHRVKTGLILDEFPTLAIAKGSIDNTIATGRSNKIATWLGFQDLQQVIRDHGKENAMAIFGTIGNIFAGSVKGETAKLLSEMFGKIKVKKLSYSVSKGNVTESLSEQMEDLISISDFTNLSQGQFAGVVSDNFGQEIKQKRFYSKMKINLEERKQYEKYQIPKILDLSNSPISKEEILENNMNKIINDIDSIFNDIN